MPAQSAKAIWTVTAGLIPGTIDEKHSRTYAIISSDWHKEGADQQLLLLEKLHEVVAYATHLQLLCANGYEVNWVNVEFVWPFWNIKTNLSDQNYARFIIDKK